MLQIVGDAEKDASLEGELHGDGEKAAMVGTKFPRGRCHSGGKGPGSRDLSSPC